ncbi:MAG: zinc ribbon domain-containing protein [Planctomycetaceae bacterium]
MVSTARLLDLQAIDLSADRLAARSRALENGEDLVAARAEADTAEAASGEFRLQLDALDRDGAKLEHEIDSLNQKTAAEVRRMQDGSVANVRELDAIGREVENLRRRTSDREDELLALLEEREAVAARAAEAEAVAAERRARVEAVAGEAAEELASVSAELERQRAKRDEVAAQIDPELLALYEDLRAHKKGVGAAALVDGVCQGCHERLSSIELDKLRHAEDVPRCEYCRRILVL